MQGAYDPSDGSGPYPNSFTVGHHPGGYLDFVGSGDHGIVGVVGTWWIMRLHSPSLLDLSTWQDAVGYSVSLLDGMNGGDNYANLFVRIHDYNLGDDRYFYSGEAQYLNQGLWTEIDFNWGDIPSFPESNYTIEEVFINIWGEMHETFDGVIHIDNVCATEIEY